MLSKTDHPDEDALGREGSTIAFRAPADLVRDADAAAAAEGISRSDIARRALLRALRTGEAA